ALARAREAANRASCANNLKQWGTIFKMFSGENKGMFPARSQWTIGGFRWAWGVNALGTLSQEFGRLPGPGDAALFPDFWNDPAILVCPSDTRSTTPPGYNGGEWPSIATGSIGI